MYTSRNDWYKELNAGQQIFEWKIFTEKECVYGIITQKRDDIAITKAVITNW